MNGNITGSDTNGTASTDVAYNADGPVVSATAVYWLWNTTSSSTTRAGGRRIDDRDGVTLIQTVYDLLGRPIYLTDPFDPQSRGAAEWNLHQYDALGSSG